jgi:hypothetical protein
MQRDQSLDSDVQQTEQLKPHKEAQAAEESPDKGEVPSVTQNDEQRFFHVANAVLAAIHPNSPELILPDGLRRGEVEAVRMLYEAKTAKESEEGGTGTGQVAATERLRFLQVALIKLQSVFAMARNPEFAGKARAHIEEIRIRLARLKDELQAAVLAEERKKAEEKDKKKADDLKADEEAKAKKKVEASTAKK